MLEGWHQRMIAHPDTLPYGVLLGWSREVERDEDTYTRQHAEGFVESI